jgi:protocatechuate 3,4-dioxygenase beta subunit
MRLEEFNRLDRSVQPPYRQPPYAATAKRAPLRPLVMRPQTLTELTGPVYGFDTIQPLDDDLTRNAAALGEPLGERIIIAGRVLDDGGRPVRQALIEVWQANAAGRYRHQSDQHPAPLDPNFGGAGRVLTNERGEYRFTTIRPGAYPWRNHPNAWRPSHVHFSVSGANFLQRLVTQMYFPGDPLLPLDPIYNGIPDERARARLIARFDLEATQPEWALGYQFDIVVCGQRGTPFE